MNKYSTVVFIITELMILIQPSLCEKCPPGTYCKNCVGNYESPVCEECPPGTFQEVYNQAAYCEKCNLCNDHFQMLKTNCTKTKNSECSCEAGYKFVEGNGYTDHCSWTGTCPDGSEPVAKEGTKIFHCKEFSVNRAKRNQANLTQNMDGAGSYWSIVVAILFICLQGWYGTANHTE